MKNIHKITAAFLLTVLFATSFYSCKKEDDGDAGLLPNISFKTGATYTSTDASISQGTPFLIGINASKSEANDVLTKFTVTRTYDTGADSVIYTQNLTGAQGDAYSYDYAGVTRSQAGKEKYKFTVINKDGLINNVTLTVTVP